MSRDAFAPVAPPLQSAFLRPVLIASAVAGLLAMLATGWALNRQAETAAGERARQLATMVAANLAPETIRAASASTPATGAFSDWSAAPPTIARGHIELSGAVAALTEPAELSLLHLRDDRRARVRNAPGRGHPDALYETLASARMPAWKRSRAYVPAMAPTLLDGVAGYARRTEGTRGDHATGYAPVVDERGGVVAIVQATVPLASPAQPWVGAGPLLWLGLLSAVVLAPLSLLWAGQAASRRLRVVGSDVRALSRGDNLAVVPDAPFAELDSIMNGFEDLFRTLQQTRSSREQERASFEARLTAALEPSEAPEAERRIQIERLAGELQVSMRVADEARSTRLVDYWHDGITVAFRPERDFDLATGMAVVLTIGTDDHPPATVPCVFVRRTVTDTCVEVMLRPTTLVSPSILPTPLTRQIEQRREPRVRPPTGAQIRVAVFPVRVGRAMAASLVDVSRQGMCLVIPVSHGAVSTWGTRLAVGLELQPGRPPIRLSGIIRAARPHRDGGTILRLELVPATSPEDRRYLHTYQHWIQQRIP